MKVASDSKKRKARENQEPKAPEENIEKSGKNQGKNSAKVVEPENSGTRTTVEEIEDDDDPPPPKKQVSATSKGKESERKELPFIEVPELGSRKVKEKTQASSVDKTVRFGNSPKYRKQAPVEKDVKAIEEMEKVMDQLVEVPLGTLAALSPALREQIRLHMTKRRIDPSAFLAEVDRLQLGETNDLDDGLTTYIEDEESDSESDIDNGNRTNSLLTVRGTVKLPQSTYTVNMDPNNGVPIGGLIVSDPVSQYLESIPPDGRKPIIVAKDSESLRAVWPEINNHGKRESITDSGSQIVAMARKVAVSLGIQWNPDIKIQMQSANNQLDLSEGLAVNVPFRFGEVVAYLQVHILKDPAYEVLLGRPFEVLTKMSSETSSSGEHSITIMDPNSGKRTVVPTFDRGCPPGVKNSEVSSVTLPASQQDFH